MFLCLRLLRDKAPLLGKERFTSRVHRFVRVSCIPFLERPVYALCKQNQQKTEVILLINIHVSGGVTLPELHAGLW